MDADDGSTVSGKENGGDTDCCGDAPRMARPSFVGSWQSRHLFPPMVLVAWGSHDVLVSDPAPPACGERWRPFSYSFLSFPIMTMVVRWASLFTEEHAIN